MGIIDMAVQSVRQSLDSWANPRTGVGLSRDKNAWAYFRRADVMGWDELEALHTHNGLAGRIVDMVPDEGMREGFGIKGADEHVDWSSVQSDLDDLKVSQHFADAWRWARLYGGALVMPKLVDGEHDLRQPLQREKIRAFRGLEVIESRYAYPIPLGGRSTIRPEVYSVITVDNKPLEVHRSRVFRIDGRKVPRAVMETNGGWAPSVLDRVRDEMKNLGGTEASAAALMHVVSQPVLKMAGYNDKVAKGGTDIKAAIQQAIEAVQEAASILGWVVVDSGDDFGTVERNMEGLVKLLDHFIESLVRATGYPRELLLALTVAGLNTGENAGPFRNWYDQVVRERKATVEPGIDWTLDLLFFAREAQGKGPRPSEWQVDWNPLWQESEAESAATAKTRAETATLNYQIGAVEASEVRQGLIDRGEIEPPTEPTADPLALPEPGQEPVDPGPTGGSVQEEALNGAQIASLVSVVEKVQAGLVPRDSAISIIRAAFPSQSGNAESILGSAGLDPATGEPPVQDEPEEATTPPPGDVKSPKEIGEVLGVSAASITNMHKRGEIAGWKIGGRWRFSVAEVQATSHRPKPGDEPQEPEGDDQDQ